MKFIVDMNLSPLWREFLEAQGWSACHWSELGSPTALDTEILARASQDNATVLTQDLDFGEILASSAADGPSVVVIRGHDVLPKVIGAIVAQACFEHQSRLRSGALMILDSIRARIRLLPLGTRGDVSLPPRQLE
jgi:predicted nuclease of predicted toxin-antitoxin system